MGVAAASVRLRAPDPADGRQVARAGRQDDLERIYADQLELPEAIVAAEQMREMARERPSALLCFERDPATCHRSLLLSAVASDAAVTHLFPGKLSQVAISGLKQEIPVSRS